MTQELLISAGQVQINDLILVSFKREMYVSLIDYLVELNIYESIFNTGISGSITLTDSRDLISAFPLQGEEFLYVNVITPGLTAPYSITRTFRIYSITNKTYAKDGSTLIYQLNFTSTETFNDAHNPIYRAFEGTPAEIIKTIFIEYLQAERNISTRDNLNDIKNPLTLLDSPTNKIKFVSPGWTPIQCINWIASKSLPYTNSAANFLFWETTKGFYFGSAMSLIDNLENSLIGSYVYSQSYVQSLKASEKEKAMFSIKSLNVEKTVDILENSLIGYLSNRLLDIDLYHKQYINKDYDHVTEFSKYAHLAVDFSSDSATKAVPIFHRDTVRNPAAYTQINYSTPKLHNKVESNFDEITKYVFGNRRSNMVELDNFRTNIVIPGRTDIEAGNVIDIKIPKNKAGALDMSDKATAIEDKLYSGLYLITSLSHKINPKTHYVSLIGTKDSFAQKDYDNAGRES